MRQNQRSRSARICNMQAGAVIVRAEGPKGTVDATTLNKLEGLLLSMQQTYIKSG